MSTQPPSLLGVPLLHGHRVTAPPPPPPPATSGSNIVRLSHDHHVPAPPPPATSGSNVVLLSHDHHVPAPPPPPATSGTNVVRLSHDHHVPAPPPCVNSGSIDVPFLHNYSCTPPPSPPRRATSGSPATSGNPDYKEILGLICFALVLLFFLTQMISDNDDTYPLFKVESVSISTDTININNTRSYDDHDSSQVPAQWNVGFSVTDPETGSTYIISHIEEYDIGVHCLDRNWTGKVVKGTFFEYPTNQIFLDATVDTLLPRYGLNQGLTFDVMLRVKYSQFRLEATCKNMSMGLISQDAIKINWINKGDPVLCHVDR